MPTQNATIATLQRQNHRLRLMLAVLGAGAIGAAGLGLSAADDAPKATALTCDGTYLYRMYSNGAIQRLDIETREDANKTLPDYYYARPINRWNPFTLKNE